MQSPQRVVRKIVATVGHMAQALIRRLRVCAYARVSTEKEEQESSYENQIEYYTKYIDNKPDWDNVGMYADQGITGTKAAKRPQFMKMIADCRAGLIDKIICKSVARFARNTVEALAYIRELKELGISIFFEREGVDTMTPGGEVLITILAGMAEQESRNISENLKWAYRKKFENGEIMMSTKFFLGYTRDKNKNIIVDPVQAVIVRRIFREFLCGMSTVEISNRLNGEGILSPIGYDKEGNRILWKPATVRKILQQEKYTGNSIMGKTYKADVLSTRRATNGRADMYYIENSHPVIISQETFDLAAAELRRRSNIRSSTKSGEGRYSTKHSLSSLLVCGNCGSKMRRFIMGYTKYRTKTANWICVEKENHKSCHALPIREEDLHEAFRRAMDELVEDKDAFLGTLRQNINAEISDAVLNQIEQIDQAIFALQQDALRYNRENRTGQLSNADYDRLISEMDAKMQKLTADKAAAATRADNVRLANFRLTEIEKVLEQCTNLTEPDEFLFREMLESVVATRERVTFNFKCVIVKEIALSE